MENHFDHCIDKDPYVQETTKIAEIRDNFGKLRFKVFLIDFSMESIDCHKKENCNTRYCITVESFCYSLHPVTILKEFRHNFKEAHDFYLTCISQYKHLAIAETRDFRDIKIYADKIGYHKIDPECCKNCKWSKKVRSHCSKNDDKLICTNHRIFKIMDCQKLEPLIEPIVEHNGICNHFEHSQHC